MPTCSASQRCEMLFRLRAAPKANLEFAFPEEPNSLRHFGADREAWQRRKLQTKTKWR